MLDNELTTKDIVEPWKQCCAFRRTIKIIFGTLIAINLCALAYILVL